MLPLLQDPEGPLAALLEGGEGWLPGLLFLATFASEDLACVGGGMLVAEHKVGFVAATLGCGLGIWISDLGLYLLGWAARRGLLRWSRLRRRVEVLQKSFQIQEIEDEARHRSC